jgi:hypothetical protein
MHIYIEISQKHKEIPCVATLASNKQKMSLFLLQNQRTGGESRSCPGWSGKREVAMAGKRGRRVNTVQKK